MKRTPWGLAGMEVGGFQPVLLTQLFQISWTRPVSVQKTSFPFLIAVQRVWAKHCAGALHT